MKPFRDTQADTGEGGKFPEAFISGMNITVFADCPHCGEQNDDEFEKDEYDIPDSFYTSCWKCKEAYHITLPIQKPMRTV